MRGPQAGRPRTAAPRRPRWQLVGTEAERHAVRRAAAARSTRAEARPGPGGRRSRASREAVRHRPASALSGENSARPQRSTPSTSTRPARTESISRGMPVAAVASAANPKSARNFSKRRRDGAWLPSSTGRGCVRLRQCRPSPNARGRGYPRPSCYDSMIVAQSPSARRRALGLPGSGRAARGLARMASQPGRPARPGSSR